MDILYVAEATAYGGREGRVTSSDDHLDVEVGIPKELGGAADNDATNPEQLLAAGYAACFQNAMIRVARKMKLDPTGSTVT
ncbi:MAG: OsmC family protein, partial [Mycobacteriales bacterium]|nr:OsmC family protein [Frankia sp.]